MVPSKAYLLPGICMLRDFTLWELGSVSVQWSPHLGEWLFVEPWTPIVKLTLPVLVLPFFSFSPYSKSPFILYSCYLFVFSHQGGPQIDVDKTMAKDLEGNCATTWGPERAIISYNFRQHLKEYRYLKIHHSMILTLNYASTSWILGTKL